MISIWGAAYGSAAPIIFNLARHGDLLSFYSPALDENFFCRRPQILRQVFCRPHRLRDDVESGIRLLEKCFLRTGQTVLEKALHHDGLEGWSVVRRQAVVLEKPVPGLVQVIIRQCLMAHQDPLRNGHPLGHRPFESRYVFRFHILSPGKSKIEDAPFYTV